jgi:hypothetical protein
MKYIVKWTNGYWKVFDSETYQDVSIHNLRSEAEVNAVRLNTRKPRQ